MRQRVLHDEDRDADVLDAGLEGDGDDPRPGLAADGRENGSEQEAGVRQTASSQHDCDGEHPDDSNVHVDGDREEDDDDEEEERAQDLADDGSDVGLEATDEDADDQWNDDDEQTGRDAAEWNDHTRVFVQQGLTEREQPQRQHS